MDPIMNRVGNLGSVGGLLVVASLSTGCGSLPLAAPVSRTAHAVPITQPTAAGTTPAGLLLTAASETCPRPDDAPFAALGELSADAVVQQVLARNPSLSQMVAAWQAASARYPQVTSLDDPMLGGTVGPASLGSNQVDFAYRLEVSQRYPFPGKRRLRGENALAEASAAEGDVEDMRLQLIESAQSAFWDYFLATRALE